MSVIRPRPPVDPLVHEVAGQGGRPWEPGTLLDPLEAIRASMVAELGGLDRPRKLLEEYGERRPESRLFAILGEARRIRDSVDRLVIVSEEAIGSATRLLVSTCCHPFHNQLPRGERGGRPRITWLDADSGADRIQGFLDLVAPEGRPRSRDLLDQWAILAVDSRSNDGSIVAMTETLVAAVATTVMGGHDGVPERLVTVTRKACSLATFAESLGCSDRFHDETALDDAQSVFTVAALLPASIAGIDIVRLLEGAEAMLTRFAEAPVASNPVLLDAICRSVAARENGLEGCVVTGGGPAIAELSTWVEHVRQPLCSHRPSREGQGVGVVPPFLVTHVSIEESRRERFGTAPFGRPPRPPARIAIRLPRLDEHALGQLLQLVILSAVVEKRLREAV